MKRFAVLIVVCLLLSLSSSACFARELSEAFFGHWLVERPGKSPKHYYIGRNNSFVVYDTVSKSYIFEQWRRPWGLMYNEKSNKVVFTMEHSMETTELLFEDEKRTKANRHAIRNHKTAEYLETWTYIDEKEFPKNCESYEALFYGHWRGPRYDIFIARDGTMTTYSPTSKKSAVMKWSFGHFGGLSEQTGIVDIVLDGRMEMELQFDIDNSKKMRIYKPLEPRFRTLTYIESWTRVDDREKP